MRAWWVGSAVAAVVVVVCAWVVVTSHAGVATSPGGSTAVASGGAPPPSTTVRVTRYPAELTQSPDAVLVGDGPIGRVIAAFVTCSRSADPTAGYDCRVVLDRADGSQVAIRSPIGDTPVSLSPDGRWLVYLNREATVVRNLVTGAVHRARPYLTPITWSANGRWLLAGLRYGGDFVVIDTTTGAEVVHEHPSWLPGATAEATYPMPIGPTYPGAVTDDGDVVRYPRLDGASIEPSFPFDVVDPATMTVRHPITALLNSPAGHVTPLRQPAMLVLGGTAYLLSQWKGAMALLPVPLSGGPPQAPRPIALTGPGPHPAVSGDQGPGNDGAGAWQTVAALPDQGLVFRVPGVDGDDLVAINAVTGSSHLLTHARSGWPLALASIAV